MWKRRSAGSAMLGRLHSSLPLGYPPKPPTAESASAATPTNSESRRSPRIDCIFTFTYNKIIPIKHSLISSSILLPLLPRSLLHLFVLILLVVVDLVHVNLQITLQLPLHRPSPCSRPGPTSIPPSSRPHPYYPVSPASCKPNKPLAGSSPQLMPRCPKNPIKSNSLIFLKISSPYRVD